MTVSEQSKFDRAVADITVLLRLLDLAGGAGCTIHKVLAHEACGKDDTRYRRMTAIAAEMDWIILGRMIVTMTQDGEDHFNECKDEAWG